MFVISILFSNLLFSQTKIDTIKYTYNQTEYKEKALSFVKKMVDANVKYGNGRNDLIYNTTDLEIIIHPIYDFKKSIKDDDNGITNLIQYIAFENNPNKQIFDVYQKGKYVYTFKFPNNKLNEIADGENIKILVGDLSIPQIDLKTSSFFDYDYIFKDHFSFYIENRYCFIVDNKVLTISDITIPKHIKIQTFNDYFFPELNRLKGEAKGIKNGAYEDYIFGGNITPSVLNINFN